MTSQEAIERVAFWTTNVAESQAIGSSTDPELGAFFNCSVSMPRCQWSDPNGPRHFDIRVPRWLNRYDEETNQLTQVENDLYLMVVAEMEHRRGLPTT